MRRLLTSRTLSIALILASAFLLRCYRLNELTGLEHDEALICLGARSIATGQSLQLTGDKVYEGPLLEYILAGAFKVLGTTVRSARLMMAINGTIAVAAAFAIALRLFGFWPALGVALTCTLAPWCLFASRVIYACNLVPAQLATAAALMLYLSPDRSWLALPSFACVGLALHGHFFSLVALAPLLCYYFNAAGKTTQHRYGWLLLGFLAVIAVWSPVLIYNLHHGFPALQVFQGNEQHAPSLSAGWVGVAGRIAGYLFTAFHSLTGRYLWPDIQVSQRSMILLPLMAVVGLILCCVGSVRRCANPLPRFNDRFLLVWLLAVVLVVPVISKHRMDWQVWGFAFPSPPHYLDVLFPLPYLFAGKFFQWFTQHKSRARWLPLVLALPVIETLIFLRGALLPALEDAKQAGRWSPGIEQVSTFIKTNLATTNPIFVSYQFEAGYPQCQFLLPEYDVIPVLEQPTGWYAEDLSLKRGTAAFIARSSNLPANLRGLSPVFAAGPPSGAVWAVYEYATPFLSLYGELLSSTGLRYTIDLLLDGSVRSSLRLHDAAGMQWAGNDLTRQDAISQHPQLAGRTFMITERHLKTLALLNRSYRSSLVEGNGWRLTLTPANPVEVAITGPDNFSAVGQLTSGALVIR